LLPVRRAGLPAAAQAGLQPLLRLFQLRSLLAQRSLRPAALGPSLAALRLRHAPGRCRELQRLQPGPGGGSALRMAPAQLQLLMLGCGPMQVEGAHSAWK
jgi:hypothetical protein